MQNGVPDEEAVWDVIVIGGGAAGLMCSAQAGKLGKQVLVLEGSNKVGKKILMSGGGRCNFTNYDVSPMHYISRNPHFVKSALKRYTPWDFIALVEAYGIDYYEKTAGQLFCRHSSKDIVKLLLTECESVSVTIKTHCDIRGIRKLSMGEGVRFAVDIKNECYYTRSVVIATGGLSIPSMGASGFGYEIAKQFSLSVLLRRASLVPLLLEKEELDFAKNLAGVSLPVNAGCGKHGFRESLLMTHKGVSGPAVLQISNYWETGEPLEIDLLPEQNFKEMVSAWRSEGARAELRTLLSRVLPKKLVVALIDSSAELGEMLHKQVFQLSFEEEQSLAQLLHHWPLNPVGTEGYRTAEVTLGGVDTNEISSKTFEAKKVPGLFFIGEVLDVTGWLGGYNFQWAWASGYCAAQYV